MRQEALWGVAHAAGMTYGQVRPMPLAAWKAHHTPFVTDCSGSVTCIAFAAGAPDPNGRNYDGLGFTGTIADHCRHVGRAVDLEAGDLIGYGNLASSDSHVVMVVDPGDDPLLFSFGGEPGPGTIRFSDEVAMRRAGGFPVAPITFMKTLPRAGSDPPAKRLRPWHVTLKEGDTVVARLGPHGHLYTRLIANARVGVWAVAHPRRWRRVTTVEYHRRSP